MRHLYDTRYYRLREEAVKRGHSSVLAMYDEVIGHDAGPVEFLGDGALERLCSVVGVRGSTPAEDHVNEEA